MKPDEEEDDDTPDQTFRQNPIAFVRKALFSFIELAKIDPILAVKTKPETATALGVGIVTLFGILGTLFGVVGASQAPVTKAPKKTETPAASTTNGAEKAPVAEVKPVEATPAANTTTKKRK
jgi:hypothetical protein